MAVTETKCLAAFTDPSGSYPPYTNITLDGDTIVITVRGVGHSDGRGYFVMGPEAQHRMTVIAFKQLVGEAVSELIIGNAKCDEGTRAILRRSITGAIAQPLPAADLPDDYEVN